MPEHLQIARALAFVERHGYALLFFWVLAEQSAIPLPSVPLLLAAGALIRTGRLRALPAFLCCLVASLIAGGISRDERVIVEMAIMMLEYLDEYAADVPY